MKLKGIAKLSVVVLAIGLVGYYYQDRLMVLVHQFSWAYVWQNLSNVAGFNLFSWSDFGWICLVTIIAFVAEVVLVGYKQSALFKVLHPNRSTWADIWCWALSVLQLFRFFAVVLSFGCVYVLTSFIERSENWSLLSYIELPALQFLVLFILGDFKHYLRHYISHRWLPFWRVHEYHHAATDMTLLTHLRGHFLELVYVSVFDALLFKILGAPIMMYPAILLLRQLHQMFIHSNVNQSWGWVGRWIFVSPAVHHIHHSTAKAHHDKNFGLVFIWWDKLFGTYFNPKMNEAQLEFGIEGSPYHQSHFWADMWIGYKRFLQSIHLLDQPIVDQSNRTNKSGNT